MPPVWVRLRDLVLGVGSALCLACLTSLALGQIGVGAGAGSTPESMTSTDTSAPIRVTGRVVSATTGMGVPRALVRLNDRAVLADHEGKFEFPQFSSQQYNSLHVTKPGFYSSLDPYGGNAMQRVTSDQLAAPLEVKLYPEALLTGTVTAPDGTPLPRVVVLARRSQYDEVSHRWLPAGQAQTNSHGEFRITVPAGDYRLETMFNGRGAAAEAVLPVVVPENNGSDSAGVIHVASGSEERFALRPRVSRTFEVSVRVEGMGTRGIPAITAQSSDGLTVPANGSMRGASGPGEMRLELPSGSYTLTGTMNSFGGPEGQNAAMLYGETKVTVADRDVTGIVLQMSPVQPIPAMVVLDSSATSDKTPPNAGQLGLRFEETQESTNPFGQTRAQLTVGRDGSASLIAIPGRYRMGAGANGQWFIKAATYGTTDLFTDELSVAAGAGSGTIQVTVSDQTGGLTGTVRLNGAPTSAWVYFVPTGPSAARVIVGHSGTNGSYNMAYLPPGTYRVAAFEQRYSANFSAPTVFDGLGAHVQTVTVTTGEKSTLDLDAVPSAEVTK